MPIKRPDRDGTHRLAFERNKKKIYATQTICGICGQPVDMKLKAPHPLSKCIDHIIPIAKGGHPSDISNLQLAHRICNMQKKDKMPKKITPIRSEAASSIKPDPFPHLFDWTKYQNDK